MPIVWVLLELEIRKVCNDRKSSFISYSEIVELCKEKQLSSDEEFIKNGLRFHHLFGVLLYFEEVKGMKNLIITDHQWLFKSITKIVCHQYGDFCDVAVNTDFEHKGLFHKRLLDKIDLGTEDIKKSKLNDTFDLKTSFLNLLKYLHIITPLEDTEEVSKFLMPSLLNTCNFNTNSLQFLQHYGTDKLKIIGKNFTVIPLLVQFAKCAMSDEFGIFPRGVFCCLAVKLLNKFPSWRSQWSVNEEVIFDNLMTFSTETGHFVTLMDKILFLEVHIRHKDGIDPSICTHIFNILSESLNFVGERFQFHNFKLIFGFTCKCMHSTSQECHITNYSLDTNRKHCYCRYDWQTNLTESHLIWFPEKVCIWL